MTIWSRANLASDTESHILPGGGKKRARRLQQEKCDSVFFKALFVLLIKEKNLFLIKILMEGKFTGECG